MLARAAFCHQYQPADQSGGNLFGQVFLSPVNTGVKRFLSQGIIWRHLSISVLGPTRKKNGRP